MISIAAGMSEMIRGFWTSLTGSRKVITGVISYSAGDIFIQKKLIEGSERRPVIDKTYSFVKMAEAHAYGEMVHKKGKCCDKF